MFVRSVVRGRAPRRAVAGHTRYWAAYALTVDGGLVRMYEEAGAELARKRVSPSGQGSGTCTSPAPEAYEAFAAWASAGCAGAPYSGFPTHRFGGAEGPHLPREGGGAGDRRRGHLRPEARPAKRKNSWHPDLADSPEPRQLEPPLAA